MVVFEKSNFHNSQNLFCLHRNNMIIEKSCLEPMTDPLNKACEIRINFSHSKHNLKRSYILNSYMY